LELKLGARELIKPLKIVDILLRKLRREKEDLY